ncbi:MAG: PLP-dependent aspartate aminotransferase family protein [Candidatus Palauibacterales bacterium]|nr:PLP-dependent aspartate aminotransferase family protein [Candidatus Palauibacterales bacterium]MDP2584546.1 PLP-dependent aspartate aminotransferase family protein [Candidatus Palauibacterales bacterium]
MPGDAHPTAPSSPVPGAGDSTTALHGGRQYDPATGAILTPIYQSTTFVQEAVGRDRGFTYTRSGNPTVVALERRLGALEEAPPAVAFATGMAAISALCLVLLADGGHAVVSQVVYGGTVRLLDRVLSRFGVAATFVDASDPETVRGALRTGTRLVLVETPANPTLDLVDIGAVAEVARGAGVPLAVDNTFLTPVLQRPLELGAEASVYSTTKFLEGHNATVGGAVVTRDAALLERLRFVRNALGIGQTPFQAWLTLRGIGTLPVRMQAHSRGAERVARWLERQPAVARVAYPTLASFPQRELALRQQRDGGGLVAFELLGGEAAGVRLMNAVRLCSLAENLGAVETLITHPASMTHADVPAAQRRRAGITDGLVRLSVGLEDPDDLIADLERALETAS